MDNIKIPLLGIHSHDDLVVSNDCIPYQEFTKNSNMIAATTTTGGHLSFFT